VRNGRFATARGHFERSEKVRDKYLQLRHVFALFFGELEHDTIAFSQIHSVRRLYVVFDYALPSATIEPTAAQTLHLNLKKIFFFCFVLFLQ
jgi:hypothetical protein